MTSAGVCDKQQEGSAHPSIILSCITMYAGLLHIFLATTAGIHDTYVPTMGEQALPPQGLKKSATALGRAHFRSRLPLW